MLHRFSNGNSLIKFIEMDSPVVPDGDTDPLTWAMVVIKKDNRYLLHHNYNRQQWECAGGGWEDGETIEECAIRETLEETSQQITNVRCLGIFKLYLKHVNKSTYGALYSATIDDLQPFKVNNESDRIVLWNPKDTLDDRISELSVWMIYNAQRLMQF